MAACALEIESQLLLLPARQNRSAAEKVSRFGLYILSSTLVCISFHPLWFVYPSTYFGLCVYPSFALACISLHWFVFRARRGDDHERQHSCHRVFFPVAITRRVPTGEPSAQAVKRYRRSLKRKRRTEKPLLQHQPSKNWHMFLKKKGKKRKKDAQR